MSVKLVLLKSGEDIVTDVQEMVVGDKENQKVVGYFFTKPCAVKMRTNEGEDSEKSFEISLFPWLPLTKDTKVPVINDWVMTIVEPIDSLKEMYEKDVLKNGKDS